MATTTYKILGQKETVSANTAVVVVSATKQTVVSTLAVINTGTVARAYTVGVVPAGQSWTPTNAASPYAFAYQVSLPANSTTTFTCGITLGVGDSIQLSQTAAGTDIRAHAYGAEITP